MELQARRAQLGRADRQKTSIEIGDLRVAAMPGPQSEAAPVAVVDAEHRPTVTETGQSGQATRPPGT